MCLGIYEKCLCKDISLLCMQAEGGGKKRFTIQNNI